MCWCFVDGDEGWSNGGGSDPIADGLRSNILFFVSFATIKRGREWVGHYFGAYIYITFEALFGLISPLIF